jgi:GNAT superfamily N-acetyltransferase
LALLSSIIAHVHLPNRAAPYPKRLTAYQRAYSRFIHPLVAGTPARTACLALDLLAIDPQFQNQEIGRAIVSAGLRQAEKEGRGVCVVCADGKETFYSRCGFGGSIGRITDGEGNPLGDVRGGEVKFWWPREFKVRSGSSS